MKIPASLLLIACFNVAFAQSPETDTKNAVLTTVIREFRFVPGDGANPVQIKEVSNRKYSCKSYRANVLVADFYNYVSTVDDVNIWVDRSRRRDIIPKHEYYESEGVFYSDARVCYFQLPIVKQGSISEVEIKKTHLDPRYFCNLFFMENLLIENLEIKLVVPDWMQLEIKEFNFDKYGVQKGISASNGETIYSFIAKNIPSASSEHNAPGITHYAPHILVLAKTARPKGNQLTYFKTIKEQYEWYHSLVEQIGNEPALPKEKAEEIIAGTATDEEKVKRIFQWVQDNIRYIAFENGIAGFKPAKAQEVLQKKYGDCKGMANLLTVMLRSIGLDARRCWIGTRHIAYDYSTPSLAVDNHMICAWMNKGKPIYLDATETYIGFGEIAERIQGRQTLIENGAEYILEKTPQAEPTQNIAREIRKFVIDGTHLKGYVVQTWEGENKERLLTQLHNIKQDRQENALKQFLTNGNANYIISNIKIDNLSNYQSELKVAYDVLWKDAVSTFEKESYVEINNRRTLAGFEIDTANRKQPYLFEFKDNRIFETEIQLPDNKTVTTLPENILVQRAGYHFSVSYKTIPGKLMYKNEIVIKKTSIGTDEFSQWNNDIKQLANAYNQQTIITQKK